jgi:hypothetical protein
MRNVRRHLALVTAASLLAHAAVAQEGIVRLPAGDRMLAGTAPVVFTLGRAEGAEHEMFGDVSGVAFDAAENLYVLDRLNARVGVYGRNGAFLRYIGRVGQGPGELIAPLQLAVSEDGMVAILDLGRPGFSVFRNDGRFVRNLPLGGWIPGVGAAMRWHPDGGIVGIFRPAPPQILSSAEPIRLDGPAPLIFFPLNGGQPRRVFEVPSRAVSGGTRTPVAGEQNRFSVTLARPPVFAPAILHGPLPGGQLALSFTTGYTIRIVDLNGRTIRYLQRPMRVRRTTQEDRNRWMARERDRIRLGAGVTVVQTNPGSGSGAPLSQSQVRAQREQQLAETQFADTMPILQGMLAAPSGVLWIERTPRNVGEPGPVDLVTPRGQYLGTISGTGLPNAISRGGLAAYIQTDDSGVARVIVREIPGFWLGRRTGQAGGAGITKLDSLRP